MKWKRSGNEVDGCVVGHQLTHIQFGGGGRGGGEITRKSASNVDMWRYKYVMTERGLTGEARQRTCGSHSFCEPNEGRVAKRCPLIAAGSGWEVGREGGRAR